jgi:hypothetical protein
MSFGFKCLYHPPSYLNGGIIVVRKKREDKQCNDCGEKDFNKLVNDKKGSFGKANVCQKCKNIRTMKNRKKEKESAAFELVTIYGTCLCGCGKRTSAEMEEGSKMIPKFAPKCQYIISERGYDHHNKRRRERYALKKNKGEQDEQV